MRVLLITDRMDHGGAETHILQLARGLSALGVQVCVLSSGGAGADSLALAGIEHISLPLCRRSPLALLKNAHALRAILRQGGFSVIHAHARLPALLLRLSGTRKIPILVTAHALFRSTPLLRRLSFWGRQTVAVSEDIRLHLIRAYGLPAERITVIPNGIDLSAFLPNTENFSEKEFDCATVGHFEEDASFCAEKISEKELDCATSDPLEHDASPCAEKSSEKKLRLAFVSRLDADCSLGAELLCEIAPLLERDFSEIRITIAGGGSEALRLGEIAREINRSVGRELLSLCGWVSDMPSFLQKQDIVVAVSRAAMEAAASGCAVILCGNEGYLGPLDSKNASRAAESNLCCRGEALATPQSLLLDLRRLLSDPSERKRVALEGCAFVRSAFSASKMCRKTLALYHRLPPSPSPKKGNRILIGGYYGCGNRGDDAILLGFLRMMRDADPSVSVHALTKSPRRDARRFAIPCHGRKNPFSLLVALLRSDLFLCGGGSLLQDGTGRLSLFYYLTLLRLAKALGKKAVLYAAGVGPLLREGDLQKSVRVLNRLDRISLRDDASLCLLQRAGVRPDLLFRGSDTALFLPLPPPPRKDALLRSLGLSPSRDYLALLLRKPSRDATLLPRLTDVIRSLCHQHALVPVLIPADTKSDLDCSLQAAEALGCPLLRPREASDVAALLSACRAGVTMRLHGAILGATVGTPMLCLSPDPRDSKLASFASSIGFLMLDGPEDLPKKYARLSADLPSGKETLRKSLAAERKKAWKDLANILEMLYNRNGQENCHTQQ